MDLGQRDSDLFADIFAAPDPRCSISLLLIIVRREVCNDNGPSL
jgi:hypothetical protein